MSWDGFREFRVAKKVDETHLVSSLYLKPVDGGELAPYLPGQHLTFKFDVPGQDRPVTRFYTISDCFNEEYYRISVKKEVPRPPNEDAPCGVVSTYIRDVVGEGDVIQVKAPKGDFYLDVESDKPVVLIAGGIGMTPMMSMLNAVLERGKPREIWFFYGLPNRKDHVFQQELKDMAFKSPRLRYFVCYDGVRRGQDVQGEDYHFAQHVSLGLLQRELPSNDFDFYICGPGPMMDALTGGLREWGVEEERIKTEAFGPASKAFAPAEDEVSSDEDGEAVTVTFKTSGVTAQWDNSYASLWEFADANGVEIDSGCLFGDCGTCMTTVCDGKVKYAHPPMATPDEGACLPCCCKPDGSVELEA